MPDRRMTILIVDDIPENITVLQGILETDYTLKVAIRGERALQLAVSQPLPDLILLDIMMPDMDGYEVCRRLKEQEETRYIPVIFITALNDEGHEAQGLQLGAVDYISKPFSPPLVKARIANQLMLKSYQDNLAELVASKTQQVALTQELTIESLGVLAECRDKETGGHIKRTKNYVRVLAEYLMQHTHYREGLTQEMIDIMYQAAPLHDIGKVQVPDAILKKPGRLTDEEFAEMKRHTTYGRDALRKSFANLGQHYFLQMAEEIAYTHHEKWDGSGYPCGLAGSDIPLSGRIMALADVYDALISRRVYKAAIPHEEAAQIICDGRGRHFDPVIIDAFLELKPTFLEIAKKFPDNPYDSLEA